MSEIPLLDGRQLRLIDLLHSTASVTRTAEQLGQTQPTVSLWLARLREPRRACCPPRAPRR